MNKINEYLQVEIFITAITLMDGGVAGNVDYMWGWNWKNQKFGTQLKLDAKLSFPPSVFACLKHNATFLLSYIVGFLMGPSSFQLLDGSIFTWNLY